MIVYGMRFLGKIKRNGTESIQTRFAHIDYLPLFPAGSMYVVAEDGDTRRGFPARISWLSILCGYLRAWSIAGILICAFWTFFYFSDGRSDSGQDLLTFAVICVGTFVGSFFFLGKNSRKERLQGAVLEKFAGVRAMPEWLASPDVRDMQKRMKDTLLEDGLPTELEAIAAYQPRELQAAAAIYAYARYSNALQRDRRWQPILERYWAYIESCAIIDL